MAWHGTKILAKVKFLAKVVDSTKVQKTPKPQKAQIHRVFKTDSDFLIEFSPISSPSDE
jgi:hypothetical protein